jgi:putative transposase
MPFDQSANPEYSKRLLRGHQMIEDGVTPKQLSKDHFEVPSSNGKDNYIVSLYSGKWQCTCPDHQFRRTVCKHIHAVTLWQRLTTKLQERHEKIEANPERILEALTCKFCGSENVIKYGKANEKQVYKCKFCARKFVPNRGFEGMWHDPRVVTTTLDLYFKGVSLRKISDHLKQCHGLEVNHSSVYRWICKYTDVMEAFIKTLEPEVGNIWHADEMKIKVKGEWKWLWNMMDEKTRFQLVSMIAETREGEDAKKTFRQSKEATSKRPNLVVTDGLPGYKGAFNSEFYDHHQNVKHAADVALQSGLNNSIERMHGSIREREKVMRGIKSMDTPFFKGNQIYMNFVRPHSALDGMTPAEAAGVGVEGGWMGLIKRSVERRR